MPPGPWPSVYWDGHPYADFGRGAVPLSSLLPQSPGGAALEDVKRELDALVGLAPVKEYVLRLEQNVRVQQRRAAQGLKAGSVAMHMIFTGNPGTGKTTVARLISKYLKAAGVLGRRAAYRGDKGRPCGQICGPHGAAYHTGDEQRPGRRAVHR